MKDSRTPNHAEILRLLPSVDAILQTEAARDVLKTAGAKHLTTLARRAADSLRRDLRESALNFDTPDYSKENLLLEAEKRLADLFQSERRAGAKRVINATGVVIHTNLGRAPLAEAARQAIADEAARYCALEYDLATGKRGTRGARAAQLLAELAGAEDALVVNNCAAACVLVLTALAHGGEAILSRGEMVEIGGDFRIPDVMRQSGAILREVGATNKTRVSDYADAVSANTRLILKVHPSNYRIIGFTAVASLAELARLAREKNIILYEDAGSGALVDLSKFGLKDEPVISDSVAAGADVVTFSGDKLLGAVQAGLIVGRAPVIEALRKHSLYRALRADKLTYAALEATLEIYRREDYRAIPALRMLAATRDEIETRARKFAENLQRQTSDPCDLRFEIAAGNSAVGGGSAPTVQPETTLLVLSHARYSAAQLEEKLRLAQPPVIVRIVEDKVALDLRTVFDNEEPELLDVLTQLS